MVSIDEQVGAIKRNPRQLLDSRQITASCREAGYCPEADGKLDPCTLIALFMQQVAAGNVSCDQVRLMGEDAFSASAYCQARMRLPLAVIQTLARQTYQKVSDSLDQQAAHLWHGHRLLLMDATHFSMADTPELQAHFGQPGRQKKGCGFPVAHLLMLFNARTGLAVDAITAPLRTHEMSLASGTHDRMAPGDLVIGDDSFGSYAHLALLAEGGMHGLFPEHHVRIVDFTPGRPCIQPQKVAKARDAKGLPRSRWIKSLGELDQIVEWFKPGQKPKWGVQKELWMFLLIYNLVRAVMIAAARRQQVAVSRISFASALHWMRCAREGHSLPRLAVVPYRPNRAEPRVIKRRPKPYDLMVRPRKKMREELLVARGAPASG